MFVLNGHVIRKAIAMICHSTLQIKMRSDVDVAEMAEQHDVKEILQLARKSVANVQDMVYGK